MAAVESDCDWVGHVFDRIGDRWSVRIVVALRGKSLRFTAIRRSVGISQGMLARALKALEREGLVDRTVTPSTPPRVDYALTPLGCSLSDAVHRLAQWAVAHRGDLQDSMARFDALHASSPQ